MIPCWIRCVRTTDLRHCYGSTTELRFSRLLRKGEARHCWPGATYFGDACSAAWYSGLLWYSTSRNPQLISVERSLVFSFLSFRNFSILAFSSDCCSVESRISKISIDNNQSSGCSACCVSQISPSRSYPVLLSRILRTCA